MWLKRQTNLHPLEFFIHAEGSCRDTFDQILLQTTERERKRSELWQKILKMCPFHYCLCLISVRTEMSICCHQELFTQYPLSKHESSKGGCCNQAATGYFCRLVSGLQQGPAKVTHCGMCYIFELSSSNQSFNCQAKFQFSHWASDFQERTNAAHLRCRETCLNAENH